MPSTASTVVSPIDSLQEPYDRDRFEDIGFMTCMTLVLLGNYSQTGHLGGPLAYTPYNVATHLAGPISAACGSTTAGPSIRTATSSCWPADTASRPAMRSG